MIDVPIDANGGDLRARLLCKGQVEWWYEYRADKRRECSDEGTFALVATLDLGPASANIGEIHGWVFILTNRSDDTQEFEVEITWIQDDKECAQWPLSGSLDSGCSIERFEQASVSTAI